MMICMRGYVVFQVGLTALHLAVEKKWEGCVNFLLHNGANPNYHDNVSAFSIFSINVNFNCSLGQVVNDVNVAITFHAWCSKQCTWKKFLSFEAQCKNMIAKPLLSQCIRWKRHLQYYKSLKQARMFFTIYFAYPCSLTVSTNDNEVGNMNNHVHSTNHSL